MTIRRRAHGYDEWVYDFHEEGISKEEARAIALSLSETDYPNYTWDDEWDAPFVVDVEEDDEDSW